jgi:ribosomal protein S18 acetylase RimI-like enzyme
VTGYFHAGPRVLQPGDSEAVRALVWATLGVTPYVDRVTELLMAAERGDLETRALVIERDGTVAALALYGPVAGANGTWHLDTVLVAPRVDLREVGGTIVEGVVTHARNDGGRLLMAELPADAALGRTLTLLRANGFRQEGRIPDFYRDGVALLFLRRDLRAD